MMTPTNEEFVREKQAYLQMAQTQMGEWRQRLDQLKAETSKLPTDAQVTYQNQLAGLFAAWKKVEDAYAQLQTADKDRWPAAKAHWERTAQSFRQAFTTNGRWILTYEHTRGRLGWLQGFVDRLTAESEGWTEGLGEQEHDSEGWTEGMGEQETDSEGWTEGYEKVKGD